MKISDEIDAQILRYYHVEKWRVGTIARQLNVHHSVVRRVLSQAGIPKSNFTKRESIITPYLSFITETLTKYPKLTASRLHEMVRQRGFAGGVDHFRHVISLHRPRPAAEAYLRLRTLPGEQGQVDWGHFGYVDIGKARRPLMAFVMVLSYSRKIFLRFYLNQQLANFLRGHEAAFTAWNGLPRVLLYDNLKSAVLERRGDAIRFHPTLLEFSSHYRYEPRPVAVARGNEKGRVERAIRYVRDNFFAARTWKNIDDLNNQAMEWCNGIAAERPCPENKELSVMQVFLEEQPKLLQLPDNPYPSHERQEVSIGKTPYARFDLNDYSVPHTHVRRTVTVCATLSTVSILDGVANLIAEHPRSFEKGKQIENESHIADLVIRKKEASKHRGQDRLIQAVPISQTLFIKAAERGYSLGIITANLLKLLDSYGISELEAAINEALSRDVPHPNAVRLSLEKRREEANQPPPIPIDLPDDQRVRDLVVRPHELKSYDQLETITEEKNNEK
jgi:transposase